MSACDTCIQPGACCRDLPLPSLSLEMTTLEVMVLLATYSPEENKLPGLPFINPRKQWVSTADGERWVVSCPLVTADGRCGEYEHRPYWPCGGYEPGQDPLCAHYVPQIGLCPDLKQPTPDFLKHLEGRCK